MLSDRNHTVEVSLHLVSDKCLVGECKTKAGKAEFLVSLGMNASLSSPVQKLE